MVALGEANTRIKDFHDIWVTALTFPFELANLVEAVGGTLHRRETAIPTAMPLALTDTFAKIAEDRGLWSGFLRRNPPTLKPPPFPELQDVLRRLFGPVDHQPGSAGRREGPLGSRGRRLALAASLKARLGTFEGQGRLSPHRPLAVERRVGNSMHGD
jgi:hypothetical protein